MGEDARYCVHCGHRADDHLLHFYQDADPCLFPGCECDSFEEKVEYSDEQEDSPDA